MAEDIRKILCVQDGSELLDALRRRLSDRLTIIKTQNGQDTLAKFRHDGTFAVVISDCRVPGMPGMELFQEVHKISPETVLLILTDGAELDSAVEVMGYNYFCRFLKKPCSLPTLEKAVYDAVEQYRLVTTERMLTTELNQARQELTILNSNLEQQVEEQTVTIRSLHQFVSRLNGLDSLQEVADFVVTSAAQMLQSRRVSLMLPDAQQKNLNIISAVGIDSDIIDRVSVPIGKPIAGRVFSQTKCLVVNDVAKMPYSDEKRYDSDFFVSMPLMSVSVDLHDKPIGVLNITERIGDECYDDISIVILTGITEAAAIALMNQIRRQERDEARDAIILALAKLAEHHDTETGAHLERVQGYCRLLSEALTEMPEYQSVIDDAFIDAIVRSSPLHDIGKVAVPDHILMKKGSLTTQEKEIMKRHSIIGGDIIRSLIKEGRPRDFLQMGMDIAYHHHEKVDGSGYPKSLAGESIPLAARILTVADVYDALISKRSYKPAYSHEKAKSIICEQSGSQFDPAIVKAFLRREQEFRQLSIELGDKNSAYPDFEDYYVGPDGLEIVTTNRGGEAV
ncbi:MAG: HD domain-containing phosphohydrolase [Planctomycetota bacterium]|jgi:response regulator RpfG family c-di-GMP phosphodiesterase